VTLADYCALVAVMGVGFYVAHMIF